LADVVAPIAAAACCLAAIAAERLVLAQVRTAEPGPCGVVPVFVREHAFENQDCFATSMPVQLEHDAGRPAHEGRVFNAASGQRKNLEARNQAL